MMNSILRVTTFFVLLTLAGCGYHIAGMGGHMPGEVKSMDIPVFRNATAKPDIESIITSSFVSEFVTTVEVRDKGDSVLQGVIKSYNLTPVSYTKSDVNQEYRLTVVLSVKLYSLADNAPQKLLWSDDNVTDYEDFTVNISDVSATKTREEEALRKLSRDTARLVKERMLENF